MCEQQSIPDAANAPSTVQDILRHCADSTEGECALLAVPRARGAKTSLSVLASYPTREAGARPLTWKMSQAVRLALAAARPMLVLGRYQRVGGRSGNREVLVAVPVILDDQHVWGAIAVAYPVGDVSGGTICTLEGLARDLARQLSPDCAPVQRASLSRVWPEASGSGLTGTPQDVLVHELRAPLSAAGYALEALAQRCALVGEDSQRLLYTVQLGIREAQSITRWAGQLRALATSQYAGDVGAVSLANILDRALRLLPLIASRVQSEGVEQMPLVEGQEIWLTQVFTNLLDNASKYTRPPDRVLVRAWQQAPDCVLVSVYAPGSGIAPEVQERIFSPYVRTVASDDLTSQGLGLSIVKQLMSAMGGEVWVESDGHSSTTLRLRLRVAPVPQRVGACIEAAIEV